MKLVKVTNWFLNYATPETQSFIKHFFNYFTGVILSCLIGVASLPIITRILSASDYGILAVFTSVISIVSIIAGLGFRASVTRYFFEQKDDFRKFLYSNLLFLMLFNGFLLIFVFIFGGSIASFFKIKERILIIAVIVASQAAVWEIFLSYLQANRESRKYSFLIVIQQLLTVVLSIVWIMFLKEHKYMGSVYATLLVMTGFSVYLLSGSNPKKFFNFNIEHVKYSVNVGLPILPTLLSSLILANFDIIIIKQLTGSYYAGLYSFAYKVGMLLNFVILAASRSWQPIFYDKMSKGQFGQIKEIVLFYSSFIYFLAVGMILFSGEIVKLLSAPEFHQSLYLVPVVVAGYVCFFLYTFYGQYPMYRKKTYYNAIYSTFCALLNVGLNYWLIPVYGYQAAAYTTVFSYFVFFAVYYLNAKYILKEKNIIPLNLIAPNLGFILLAIIVFYVVNDSIRIYALGLVIKLAVLIAIGMWLLRKSKKTKARFANAGNSE